MYVYAVKGVGISLITVMYYLFVNVSHEEETKHAKNTKILYISSINIISSK